VNSRTQRINPSRVDPSRVDPSRIGLIGAESSGKTTLALALVNELNLQGTYAVFVPEYLRTWCEKSGRIPLLDDQPEILIGQLAAEDLAARNHPGAVLVCDPAAITTPLYSQLYFEHDAQIDVTLLKRYQQLLWCDIDFDWVPDPLRDGPLMRRRMHDLIANYVPEWERIFGKPIPMVTGGIEERLRQAWQPNLPIISP
jgi:nicotinamide riboside kinase